MRSRWTARVVFFTDNCTHDLYMRANGVETLDIGEYTFLAANGSGSELLLEKRDGEAREIVLYDIESRTPKLLFTVHQVVGLRFLKISMWCRSCVANGSPLKLPKVGLSTGMKFRPES